jgi:HEAT repeat protein
LSIAGKPGVADEIRRLSLRAQDPFRSTAAWAMGKLGDSAFLDPLQRLVRDDSPTVRGTALKAMIGIRRIEATMAKAIETVGQPAHVIETEAVVPVIDIRLDGRSFAYTRENIDQQQ